MFSSRETSTPTCLNIRNRNTGKRREINTKTARDCNMHHQNAFSTQTKRIFFATYALNLDSCIPETSSGGSGRFQQDILHFSGWIQPQGVRPLPSIHPAEPDAGAVPHVHVELPQLLVLALADPRGQVCLIALRIRTCRLR